MTNLDNESQSTETDNAESDENDIKNYTWRDKSYYKLYQRQH